MVKHTACITKNLKGLSQWKFGPFKAKQLQFIQINNEEQHLQRCDRAVSEI